MNVIEDWSLKSVVIAEDFMFRDDRSLNDIISKYEERIQLLEERTQRLEELVNTLWYAPNGPVYLATQAEFEQKTKQI